MRPACFSFSASDGTLTLSCVVPTVLVTPPRRAADDPVLRASRGARAVGVHELPSPAPARIPLTAVSAPNVAHARAARRRRGVRGGRRQPRAVASSNRGLRLWASAGYRRLCQREFCAGPRPCRTRARGAGGLGRVPRRAAGAYENADPWFLASGPRQLRLLQRRD